MNDNYFNKAVTNLNTAKILINFTIDDESQLNIVAYHLSQAIELCIKFLLEMNGIEYFKTYDIEQLINNANENELDLYLTEYVIDHSEMFTQWEGKTRYVINYKVQKDKIDKAIIEVEKYLENVKVHFDSNKH